MIHIECDNCERTFEVDPGEVDEKVACPFCGDVNRVPDGPVAASGAEQEIRRIHPAMVRAHPFRFLAIMILLAGGIAGAVWLTGREDGLRWLKWPCLLVSLFAVGWWVAWYLGAHLWVKLTISNKRTVRAEGIIRRYTSEVLHEHVRNVEIRQTFLQRIFDVGYLGISSAGQDDIEIEVRDVPKPYEIKKIIDRHRNL